MIEADRPISAGAAREDDHRSGHLAQKAAGGLHRTGSRLRSDGDLHRGRLPAREALDHLLIFGPPPALARPRWPTSSPTRWGQHQDHLRPRAGEGPAIWRHCLTNLEPNDVLFIDEIHRLSPVVEEVLYPAMEDYQLDIMIGEGQRPAPSSWISLPSP